MAVTVYIPTPFRRATASRDRVEVRPGSVREALEELERAYPGLKELIRDDAGGVRAHVNLYVNSEAIESRQDLATPLRDGDELAIIPALAGGRR